MSRNNHNHRRQQSVQQSPVKFRLLKLLCVTMSAACSITAAIVAFLKIFAPSTPYQLGFAILVAVSLYIYGGLDTTDKCQKWGLIKN